MPEEKTYRLMDWTNRKILVVEPMTADDAASRNTVLESEGKAERWELFHSVGKLLKDYKDGGNLKI